MPNAQVSPLEHALLTRDWDAIKQLKDRQNGPRMRLATAIYHVQRGDYDTALATSLQQPSESTRYVHDIARWKLGTLRAERGEVFADAFEQLHRNDVVTIATIQKSGTHWMRYFLANYARALAEPTVESPISYKQLINRYYGNNRWQVFREAEPYRTPSQLLVPYGISDVNMQHFRNDFDPFIFSPGRKIMLYRNPLDFVVSLYHYMIKQRPQNRHRAGHPREVIERMLDEYSRHYLTLNTYRKDQSVFVASYEELKHDPPARFREVVRFLELPVVDHAVDRALMLSDISTIRAMEERMGRSMVVKLDGFFTRDGSIGQWKRFFKDDDLSLAAEVLERHGIKLDDFVIDV